MSGIFEKQRAMTADIENALLENPGTVVEPTVFVNPYHLAPLSALVCFVTDEAESFNVTLKDDQGRAYLSYETPHTSTHRIIVPAMVDGQVTTFEAVGSKGSKVQLALPAVELERPMQIECEGAAPEGTLLFALPADGAGQPVAVNQYGDLCWSLMRPLNHRLHFLDNGHMLTGAPLQMAPPYSGTAIWELDALGHIYKEIRFEDGFISDFVVLEDGTIVAIGQAAWQGTIRDTLLWINSESGAIEKRLAASSVLAPTGGNAGQSGSDWFQGISVRYDRENGLLYWSSLAQDVVLVVDAKTAEVVKIIGHTDGWDEKRVATSLFTRPVPRGTFEQAYGVQYADGALYYINANRYPLGKKLPSNPFTVNRLDLKSGRVSPYIRNTEGLISPVFCDLKLLEDGHALVLAGGLSNTTSHVPAVFARERQDDISLSARATLYHQGEKQAAWTFNDNLVYVGFWQGGMASFDFAVSGPVGEWTPSYEVDIELPIASESKIEAELALDFWQDDARLYLSGTFYKGEACVLVLKQGEEKHQYFLNSNLKPFGAEWLYTYSDGIERWLNWAIPCGNLHGDWQVEMIIDDCHYSSDVVVHFE